MVIIHIIQAMSPEIYTKLIPSFLVGGLGSAAYITALYFKFVGDTDANRAIVTQPFRARISGNMSFLKCSWYCIVGGFIAVVFQFDVPTFVAVQSLILGATWPAIVSQFLSGRMVNPKQEELQEVNRALTKTAMPQFDFKKFRSEIETLNKK